MATAASFWKHRKVLVTGGNSFIGSFVVEQLLQWGATVTTTASQESTRWRFLEPVKEDLHSVVGNLDHPDFALSITRGQDIILYLAARVGGIEYNRTHPGSLFRDNMRAFINTLDAARINQIPRMMVTSSACVYPRESQVPTPESEGFKGLPEPTNAGYGWSKRMQEYMAQAYHDEFGMDIVVARPFNAYGPRDNFDPASSHVIPGLIHKIESGVNPLVVWGDGSASRSFLYVTDFAQGLLTVAEKATSPAAINIGTPEESNIGDLARLLVKLSGRDLEIVFDPSKPNGQPRRNCDNTFARTQLGFEAQVPLSEGLTRTLAYYRSEVAPK